MNDARSATGLVIRLPWTIIHFHHSTTAVNKCVFFHMDGGQRQERRKL